MNLKQAKELVRSRLSDKRYEHTLNVKKMAVKLAKIYGEDEERAALAALLHDIGIHEAERQHSSSAGPYQEQEGPAVARPLLSAAGADESEIERICWLIAHHHSCQAGEDTESRAPLTDFRQDDIEPGAAGERG